MTARLVRRSLLLAPVTCGLALAVAQPSFATTSFTWSGGDANPGWSLANNWVGGMAPNPGDAGDALVFPAVPSGGDCSSARTDACYHPQVDETGYPITGLTIDDGVGYQLSGDQLTLGTGGIAADTSGSLFDPATITADVGLGTGQMWTIDGGSSGEGELKLEGVLAGSTEPLTIDLGNVGYLDLTNSSDNVGDVTITGTDSSQTGPNAYSNGALALDPYGALNANDGNPIQLTDAAIYGNGSLGPVTSTGGELAPGTPTGTLGINGQVSLDAASALQFAIGSDGVASELTSTGTVDLGGAELDLTGAAADGSCPAVSVGSTFTLVSTTGTVSNAFGNVTSGANVTLACGWASPPVAQITIGSGSVTAKIVSAGTPPPTTTQLSVSPSSVSTNDPVTLTATVTETGQSPAGDVDFTSDGHAILGCSSQHVSQVGPLYHATCSTSFGAAGSPHTLLATFYPSGLAEQSSSSPTQLTVQQGATTTQLTDTSGSGDVSLRALPARGYPLTVGADVSPNQVFGSSWPSGTVEFLNNGAPIAGCSAVAVPALVLNGLGTAECNTTVLPSGSGITAIYSGDANFAGSSAHVGLMTFPVVPTSLFAPTATFSNAHVHGKRVAGTVNCTVSGAILCDVEATLTVKATMSGSKVVAVSASHKSRSVTKTLTIGHATGTSLPDGFSTLDVTLDATGRELLAAHHRLVARLTVTSRSGAGAVSTIFNRYVTFVQHKKRHP